MLSLHRSDASTVILLALERLNSALLCPHPFKFSFCIHHQQPLTQEIRIIQLTSQSSTINRHSNLVLRNFYQSSQRCSCLPLSELSSLQTSAKLHLAHLSSKANVTEVHVMECIGKCTRIIFRIPDHLLIKR